MQWATFSDAALSSYEILSSDWIPSENLATSEIKALRHSSKNKNNAIHKADGNTNTNCDSFPIQVQLKKY